ncbi:hypothetical protein P691DRAFT_800407 [Macrolepiota fuliginosa MF-IS2]|uniref:Uncharacterized protein n=1 Tax=Macrolepiota fuliginosa MF-IS2 TaxID=1400762 RepID=A0A9P5XDI9_9AGAR|nr:hypothetical protein P691DRAFT_800407 [Macrolepiota fuliginosa MF-IS2]
MAHQVIQEMPFRMLDLDKMACDELCSVIYRSKRSGAPLPPAFQKQCDHGCGYYVRQKPSHEADLGSPDCLSRPPNSAKDPFRSMNTRRCTTEQFLGKAAPACEMPFKFLTRRTGIHQMIL